MFRKFMSVFLTFVLSFLLIPAQADWKPEVISSESVQVLADQASPESGDFDALVYRSKSGQHVVLRIKFPLLGDKIQLMKIDSKGRAKQLYSYTLTEDGIDQSGNYLNLDAGNLVKVFSLTSSKTTFQILLNGEEYLERKTITKLGKPSVKLNNLVVTSPISSITGDGQFQIELRDIQEGSAVRSMCLNIDEISLSNQQAKEVTLGSEKFQLDGQGCISFSSGIQTSAPIDVTLNTKLFTDGRHKLVVRATLLNSADKEVFSEGSATFLTDNMSLNATAPNPTISGSLVAGQVISVVTGNWGNLVTFSYKWYSNDVLIRGANSDRYLLTYADVGKVLKVEVKGSKSSDDQATRFVETSTAISEQGVSGASQGNSYQTSTGFNVVEQSNVYNSTTRKYEIKEVNNYNISLSQPSTVICAPSSSYYSTCSFKVSATWGGTFDAYESFSQTVRLIRISDRSLLDTDSLYLSSYFSTDSLEFSFSNSSLSSNNSLNQYRLEITSAGYNQTLTANGAGVTQIIRGPNTQGPNLSFSSSDRAISQSQSGFGYQGGTASAPNWVVWKYAAPYKVKVMQACAILPIYVAPQSIVDGSLTDQTTRSASDATISIFGGNGQLREKLIINGSRGDWDRLIVGNKVDVKVCGLNMQKGKVENLRLQLDLRNDAYNLEASSSTSLQIQMIGNMKFTKINCYLGEDGKTINAYKPACPEGWTQTKAKVSKGKVAMKTLNCLAGRDLEIVRAPEPVCPEGYEVTKLSVKNGKLVPWSIVCRKGFGKKIVKGVFPACPAGYVRSY